MIQPELTYVIEDDPITATTTKFFLEKNLRGGRVQTYANGQQAFQQLAAVLREGGNIPDLILLDLNMPLMDGWEFLEAISHLPLLQPVCVLVLTSSINPADHLKATSYQQVAGYFSKPLELSKLTRLLRLRSAAQGPDRRESLLPAAPLHHLVYQSQATTPLAEEELARLLTQSRAFNAAHGVSGILLYSEGNIIQLLEGSATTIDAVFARIARDPRHTRVVKLADGPVPHRLFAQWSMGFQVVKPVDFAPLTGYVNPDQVPCLVTNTPRLDPNMHTLLATFVSTTNRFY